MIELYRGAFYQVLIDNRDSSGRFHIEDYDRRFEKWFAVDTLTGKMWLFDSGEVHRVCEDEREPWAANIPVARYSDVAVPLYDASGEFLGMCGWAVYESLVRWLFSGDPPPYIHKSSDKKSVDLSLSGYEEVRIIPDPV